MFLVVGIFLLNLGSVSLSWLVGFQALLLVVPFVFAFCLFCGCCDLVVCFYVTVY